MGTDEDLFNRILTTNGFPQIAEIAKAYQQVNFIVAITYLMRLEN